MPAHDQRNALVPTDEAEQQSNEDSHSHTNTDRISSPQCSRTNQESNHSVTASAPWKDGSSIVSPKTKEVGTSTSPPPQAQCSNGERSGIIPDNSSQCCSVHNRSSPVYRFRGCRAFHYDHHYCGHCKSEDHHHFIYCSRIRKRDLASSVYASAPIAHILDSRDCTRCIRSNCCSIPDRFLHFYEPHGCFISRYGIDHYIQCASRDRHHHDTCSSQRSMISLSFNFLCESKT